MHGDSNTYGFGASGPEHSYPSLLQNKLDGAGARWHVVNQGWPGANSREVLQRLPWQLAHWRPRRVYVQVGFNDIWSRPDELVLDETQIAKLSRQQHGGFVLRWRTKRLLEWLLGELGGKQQFLSAPSHDATLAGTAWRANGTVVVFEPDGTLLLQNERMSWRQAGSSLEIRGLDTPALRFEAEIRDGRLALTGGADSQPWVLTPIPTNETAAPASSPAPDEPESLERRGLIRLQAGDFTAALDLLHRALEGDPLRPQSLAALARAAHHLGRRDEEDDAIAALQEAFDRHPCEESADALLTTLDDVGRDDRCAALLPEALRRFPDAARLWAIQARHDLDAGDPAAARIAIRRAVATLPKDDGLGRAECLRQAAEIELPHDPTAALRDLVLAYHSDGKGGPFSFAVEAARDVYDPAMLDAVLADSKLPDGEASTLRALFERARDDDAARLRDHYASHLPQVIALCRRAGATPVLIGYPFPDRLAAVRAEVANETGTTEVLLAGAFDAALQGKDRSSLFVPDGHCNDAGYELMASLVFEASIDH